MLNWNSLPVGQDVTHVMRGTKLYAVEDFTAEQEQEIQREEDKQELLLKIEENWNKFFDAIS